MTGTEPSFRIPNLLHALFFFTLTVFAFLLAEAGGLALTHKTPVLTTLMNQKIQLFVEAAAYGLALAAAWFAMPVFWHRPFLAGLQWNADKVRPWLGLVGIALGFAVQGISVVIPHPKDLPIEDFFHNPELIWFMAFFGVVVGPLFEEVLFRGFLLPAIAIAVDYIRIPRDADPLVSLERLIAWRSSTGFSQAALVVSTIVTSLFFALLHAPQLGYTWPAVALLAAVSVVLCVVRIRTGSVAASTVVHGFYNLSVFVSLFLATGGFRHLDRV